MVFRIGGKFAKHGGAAEPAHNAEKSELDIGVHLLAAAVVFAIVVVFLAIPEFSYKPTRRLRPEDISGTQWMLVPNGLIRMGTHVKKINRISGDRQVSLSQDMSPDEIVLVTRDRVDGDFMALATADSIPVHAEVADLVPWMTLQDCHRRSEELGFLVASA